MAEQIGVVVENQPNGMSRVLTNRQRAHGGCHPGLACDQLESRATNPVEAEVGDVVKIALPQKGLFKGAALMYLLPMAALITGSVAGLGLGSLGGWAGIGSVLGGLGGLAVGFGAVKGLGRSRRLNRELTPVITEILNPTEGPPRPPQASCCG